MGSKQKKWDFASLVNVIQQAHDSLMVKEKVRTASAQFKLIEKNIAGKLSYSHLEQLVVIKDLGRG